MIEKFIKWYSNINQAKALGSYAPHKPLTIMYALVNAINGKRWIRYTEDRKSLEKIIAENTKFSSRPNCLQPLWRLTNDSKKIPLWEAIPKTPKLNKSGDISSGEAVAIKFKAGFSEEFYSWITEDISRAQYLISELLKDNFPESLHSGILEMLGVFDLIANPSPLDLQKTKVSQIKRDPKFPPKVLALYDNKCAFCGLKISFINNEHLSMEAAHIKWKKYGGECSPENGMALCPTHHYTFDRGIWTIKDDYQIKLSENIILDKSNDVFFEPYINKDITRHLLDSSFAPALENLTWHNSYILK